MTMTTIHMTEARQWLERISALPHARKVRIMNVCGGHERSVTLSGMRTALPDHIEIIPGPGCPVCVCPEEDIHQAIQLAVRDGVILVAFGDMLRVPVNVPKGEIRTLASGQSSTALRQLADELGWQLQLTEDRLQPDDQLRLDRWVREQAEGQSGGGGPASGRPGSEDPGG